MDEALRQQIIAVLDEGKDLTLATLREDGYPQATTVGYASDGLAIWFGCSSQSQKAHNLARDDRISATVDLPYGDWTEIRGLSLGGRARRLTDEAEAARAGAAFLRKFAPQIGKHLASGAGDMALFQIEPEVISLLDYQKGFGHNELVRLSGADLSAPRPGGS